jgi:hypothetical protein
MPVFSLARPLIMRASVALLSLVIFLAACRKKDAAEIPPTPSDPAVTGQPAKPLPPPPKSVTVNAENNVRENVGGEVDQFLTSQLKIFISEKGRLPASFAEFAGARLDSMPRPPEGAKWVIDAPNQQVKSVPMK